MRLTPKQREILRAFERYLAQNLQEGLPADGHGRRPGARGLARSMAARDYGVTPDAVRKLEQRVRASVGPPEGEPVLDLGMQLDPGWAGRMARIRDAHDSAARALTASVTKIYYLRELEGVDLDREGIVELYRQTQALADKARGMAPYSLCPYCKGVQGIQESCGGCRSRGWISQGEARRALKTAPDELWDDIEPTVVVHGQLRRLRDVADGYDPPPADDDDGDMAPDWL